MPLVRHQPEDPSRNRPNLNIPEAQRKALERRQALEIQQRAFRATATPTPTGPPSSGTSRRPPT